MLNQILQVFLLCFAALILTTEIAFSSPVAGGLLLAEHTLDHADAISQPAAAAAPTSSPPADTPGTTQPQIKGDRDTPLKDPKPTQANPSVPYDPYDYDAIRELNHEIYGEVKDAVKDQVKNQVKD